MESHIAAYFSTQALIAAGVNPTSAKTHATWLADAAVRFRINTPRRAAAFLGQCMHETQGLTAFEENLYYSRPERILEIFRSRVKTMAEAAAIAKNPQALANKVYSGRYGNGDEASGDGWRYRGRGAGHLTFKDNYAGAGKALGQAYVYAPEMVSEPKHAALTFAWYWETRGCNAMADTWGITAITKAINPGMAGANERAALCGLALECMA